MSPTVSLFVAFLSSPFPGANKHMNNEWGILGPWLLESRLRVRRENYSCPTASRRQPGFKSKRCWSSQNLNTVGWSVQSLGPGEEFGLGGCPALDPAPLFPRDQQSVSSLLIPRHLLHPALWCVKKTKSIPMKKVNHSFLGFWMMMVMMRMVVVVVMLMLI